MVAVKNYNKFQHFKDRRPPWIKLYRDLLDDVEWHDLEPKAAKALVMIWLIASEDEGKLPELKKLAFRLRLSRDETTELLETLSHWLRRDDDNTISVCHQDDIPEGETETETETEIEGETEASSPSRGKPRSVRAPVLPDEEWLDAMQKNPAYSMLNVRLLYQRMLAWCEVKGKVPSRRRLINWLNREDRPMTANGSPPKKQAGNAQVGASPKQGALEPAPDGGYMLESVEEFIAADDIESIGQLYDAIVQRGGAKAEWEIRAVAYYELHKTEVL